MINIASLAGVGGGAHPNPEYAAAKAGVIRFTTALAGLAADGVRVNCISPDWVDTPASRRTLAAMRAEELADVPPVMLTSEQIAATVVMLACDDTLAGRVVEYWCGADPHLLPA